MPAFRYRALSPAGEAQQGLLDAPDLDQAVERLHGMGLVPVRLTPENGYYGRPIWSPDGTRVAFSAWASASDQSQIFIAAVDGSTSTRITPAGTSDYDPTWSPDGTRLAFIRLREQPVNVYHFDVVVADVDGTNVRPLASSTEFASAPSWSPDGRQIIVALGGGLSVMNADGSALTRITMPTAGTYDGAPTWRWSNTTGARLRSSLP